MKTPVSRPDVDASRIALEGLSLGGYLAPRAAAFEPRLAACIANGGVYDFMGSRVPEALTRELFASMLENAPDAFDAGMRYGLPTLAVTAVGKEMVRDARYLGMSCRVCAELGAQFVKTYYCEPDFEQVTSACPVPIVIAGGKKIPEPEALELAYKAISQGAAGVDMGRNIFAAEDPIAMIQAVRAVVHNDEKPDKALDMYETLKNEQK